MPKIRIDKFMLLMLGVLAVLQYRLWFESGGIKDVIHLKNALSQQEASNMELRKRNADLIAQIKNMKNSEDAEESRARSELGMIKKGETFYQVLKS